jgi:cell division GTPase FtsZ
MKIVVVGCGQCGSRIADEFARLGKKARKERRIDIVTGAFAVNTDAADLSGLSCIKSDYRHRILIGGRRTSGHGVGKINEVAAEIARTDADKVIDAIKINKHFYESDAVLLVAGTAGGTGSGSISVLAQAIKQRYIDKSVYAILVLPFEHEEHTEHRTVYNTATCLKSVSLVADATILIDNQRYIKKDASLKNNMAKINKLIVAPFYDLLCVGEEKKVKNIGARLLDAGDIMQTLSGWTIIGYGESSLPLLRLPFEWKRNFQRKSTETHKGIQAMDGAVSELSLECDPKDSSRALYLLSAPTKEMNMDLVKELGEYLKDVASEAIIRYGDYPRGSGALTITVILSGLKRVARVKQIYDRFPEAMERKKKIEEDMVNGVAELADASDTVPSLL